MSDTWCKPLKHNNKMIAGGAARNVRIAALGGMDAILQEVAFNAAFNAAKDAVNRADEILNPPKKLRLVK